MAKEMKEVDIFRDTYVRYLGYANEVGEAFRGIVAKNLVRFSYAVAIGYVIADSSCKAVVAYQQEPSPHKIKRVALSASDCLIWQGFASVVIPGFTINRICYSVQFAQKKFSGKKFQSPWISVAIGLISIPFIIHPIDALVENGMNLTYRKWVGHSPNIAPD
ncbi:mitochondrial fission process protein 1 [Neodiprion pinetum]|uniref:Mitochondrial fission process protein 1 n=1 Tax=Neodiprion lecontei TaxID=441921 RepID=A0A6J0BFL6_NEOLC|nr:mitochondrial fission process protein 1 [Neodiprion lecontei]XP_046415916.1 mitochondrial fission process protein 1 [Neodiprion fabricii]XP_046471763.1 mitochondrial fission process protein 1 [Neodiprion pinetum]XP_046609695.1 mitochondrial fission process protein 1 [Neodiprion virginianus]